MAKSTNASNLFAGFNPPKKKAEPIEVVQEETPKELPKEEPKLIQEHADINVLVQEEVRKIMESQQLPVQPIKVGRPKKYEKDTKVISVRLDADIYEFVRNKGRTEYDSITDYITQLVRKEMEI